MRTVRCAARILDEVLAWARAEQPRECCGLLLGRGDEIVEVRALRNVAGSADRFELDPVGHIQARKDARAGGLVVAGVFHSHPHSAAQPSPRDLAEASYTEYLYGIVSLQDPESDFRLFELVEGRFEEVAIATG